MRQADVVHPHTDVVIAGHHDARGEPQGIGFLRVARHHGIARFMDAGKGLITGVHPGGVHQGSAEAEARHGHARIAQGAAGSLHAPQRGAVGHQGGRQFGRFVHVGEVQCADGAGAHPAHDDPVRIDVVRIAFRSGFAQKADGSLEVVHAPLHGMHGGAGVGDEEAHAVVRCHGHVAHARQVGANRPHISA